MLIDVRSEIIKLGNLKDAWSVNDLLRSIDHRYTRAYVLRFIKTLITEGILVKSGKTRAAIYALAEKADQLKIKLMTQSQIRLRVLETARNKQTFVANDVIRALGGKFTRAYVLRFIQELLQEEVLVKSGTTRLATYALKENAGRLANDVSKRYVNKGLHEHEVYQQFLLKAPFLKAIPEHVGNIVFYAFSEMLNNAIEHSESRNITIGVRKRDKRIEFVIDDHGIGVFANVMKHRHLGSEIEAAQDLLKGKITTAPHAHSGEGIFFTSKAVDEFVLDSHRTRLQIASTGRDVSISPLKPARRGTRVAFRIHEDHLGHLDDVFRQYYTDPEELAFDQTEVQIKLYDFGSIYVSRSQARRVLSGLEKFRSVILDFDRVNGVGQAFADEIFRVFTSRHPDITVTPKNMNEAVAFMVGRVERPGRQGSNPGAKNIQRRS